MFYIPFDPLWSDASNGIGLEFTWCTCKKLLSLRWSIFVENASQFPGNLYKSAQITLCVYISYMKKIRLVEIYRLDPYSMVTDERWWNRRKNGVRFSSKSSKSSKSSIRTGTIRLAVIDLVYPWRNFPDIPYPRESVCSCTHRTIGTINT